MPINSSKLKKGILDKFSEDTELLSPWDATGARLFHPSKFTKLNTKYSLLTISGNQVATSSSIPADSNQISRYVSSSETTFKISTKIKKFSK